MDELEVVKKERTSRLSDDVVMEIRREYIKGKISQLELGAKYGVSFNCVSRITRGASYKHLPVLKKTKPLWNSREPELEE